METFEENSSIVEKYIKEINALNGEEKKALKIGGDDIVDRIPECKMSVIEKAETNLAAGDGSIGTTISVVCQQTQVITDDTFETTFHDFKALVNLYESMSAEKLNTLERSLSETVHEVGVIYHQSLCKGLSVLAADNSDNDSLFCDKVTMFVDEKARSSQHFIEEMISECKDDVRETRDRLLGDILYEFNRGVRLTSEEFIRVSRKEIHGYLDDLEDAYISKSDRAAAEFCRKLLERTWADFKQERDRQLCDHSEKKNCTEGAQNIGEKNKSIKEKLKNIWRGFKKLLCCC